MFKNKKLKTIAELTGIILIFSFIFSFFFNYFVLSEIDEFDQKFKNVVGQLKFYLPEKDTYLIKIWGLDYPKSVYFNHNEVSALRNRSRGILNEVYILADYNSAKKGQNILVVRSNGSYSVRVRNFYGATDSKGVIVLFKGSSFLKSRQNKFILVSFLTTSILICFWAIFYSIVKLIFKSFESKKVFFVSFQYNFVLLLILLLFVCLVSFTPYRAVLSPAIFLGYSIFLLSLTFFIAFCQYVFKHSRQIIFATYPAVLISYFTNKPLDDYQELYADFLIKNFILHFKRVPDKYLVGYFILLMIACMMLLCLKLYTLANWVSYLAYFCLFGGLINKYIKLVKEGE